MGFFKKGKSDARTLEEACAAVTSQARTVRDKCERSIRGKYEYMRPEQKKGEDADAIKKAIDNLGTASQELGKVLYEEAAKKQAASAATGQAGQQTSPPPAEEEVKRKGGDDVIDAEFEAKDSSE